MVGKEVYLGVLDNPNPNRIIKGLLALASTQYILHVINKGGGVLSTGINSEYVRKVKRGLKTDFQDVLKVCARMGVARGDAV